MSTKVYNADEVTVLLGGSVIDSGYADGEFLSIEMMSDQVQSVAGTDGEVAVSRIRDRRANAVLKLLSTSTGNDILSAKFNQVMNGIGSPSIGSFYVRDRNGRAIYEAQNCWITKPPDVSFDRSVTPREWHLSVDFLERQDGGNNDAQGFVTP